MELDTQYINPIVFYESVDSQIFRQFTNVKPVLINQNKFPPLFIPMRGIQFTTGNILDYFTEFNLINKKDEIIADILDDLNNSNFIGIKNETLIFEQIQHFMISKEFNYEMPFNEFYFQLTFNYPFIGSSGIRSIYSNLICTKAVTEPIYVKDFDDNLLLPINFYLKEKEFLENRFPNEAYIIPLVTNNRIVPFQIQRDHNVSNTIDAFELVDDISLETKVDLETVTDAPIIIYNETLEKDNITYYGLEEFTSGIQTGNYRIKVDDGINVYYSDKINILSEVIIPNTRDYLMINDDDDYFLIDGTDKILINDN